MPLNDFSMLAEKRLKKLATVACFLQWAERMNEHEEANFLPLQDTASLYDGILSCGKSSNWVENQLATADALTLHMASQRSACTNTHSLSHQHARSFCLSPSYTHSLSLSHTHTNWVSESFSKCGIHFTLHWIMEFDIKNLLTCKIHSKCQKFECTNPVHRACRRGDRVTQEYTHSQTHSLDNFTIKHELYV